MDTLIKPYRSIRGSKKHSPYLLAVLHAKQGKKKNEIQPRNAIPLLVMQKQKHENDN